MLQKTEIETLPMTRVQGFAVVSKGPNNQCGYVGAIYVCQYFAPDNTQAC